MAQTRYYGTTGYNALGAVGATPFTTLGELSGGISFNTVSYVNDAQFGGSSAPGTYVAANCNTTRSFGYIVPDAVIPDGSTAITVTSGITNFQSFETADGMFFFIRTGAGGVLYTGFQSGAAFWADKTGTRVIDGSSTTLTGTTFKSSYWGFAWANTGGSHQPDAAVSNFILKVVFTLPAPGALTAAATNITSTTATLNGFLDAGTATSTYPVSYKFQYGTTAGYGTNTTTISGVTGSGAFGVNANISSLSSSTLYHYRLQATNADNTVNSTDGTFTTNSSDFPLFAL